ncbi:MAG: hypothetical protein ACK41T_02290 [Pseudobdellovibrio sp.]
MLIEVGAVLSSVIEKNDFLFYETMNGYIGTVLKYQSIDLEIIDDTQVKKSFNFVLNALSPDVHLKWVSDTQRRRNIENDCSRKNSISDQGFFEDTNYVIIEAKNINSLFKTNNSDHFYKLQETVENLLNIKIEYGQSGEISTSLFTKVNKQEIEQLFLDVNTPIIKYPDHLVIDQKLVGLVRIKQNTEQSISFDSINNIRQGFNKPHKVITQIKKISNFAQEMILNNLESEGRQAKDLSENRRASESENLRDLVTNQNHSLMEIEVIFQITSIDEKSLRQDLKLLANLVQKEFGVGSEYIENKGTFQSFIAIQPGSGLHVPFKDLSSGVLNYLPLFSHKNHLLQNIEPDSLLIHRKSDFLQSIQLISNLTQSGNTMIVGPKGSGKSVLCGLLTQSLLNNPNHKILKMDVGSSYVRECEQYNGTRFSLDLNTPSGLNPLDVIAKTPFDLEIADIVSDFIEVLISKEIGHKFGISDEERADLDRVIIQYSESRPKNPTLDDFLKFSKSKIPNPSLLERWTTGGMYQNIFKPVESQNNDRYRYYDFVSVNNSTNASLVRGSIAAVMAQYNSEVAISGRNGPRIFLFCDETTEFLNQCSPFFISTAKNCRKFGHGIILINQESGSFQVRDRKGTLTNSLFENADHHFLFSYPSDAEDIEKFKSRHKLSGFEYSNITKLKYQKGKYSEVFYKTRVGGQTLKVQLSADEYWLLTSDKSDYDKLAKLIEVGFSQKEAMQCLRQLHSQLY